MKVLMIPYYEDIAGSAESGIKRVCEAYYKYLPKYGIQFVKRDEDFDLLVAHAGMTGKSCDVSILHGLYWTADYPPQSWELDANKSIAMSVRSARKVTVPSEWVAETVRRDLKVNPIIIPHGIEAEQWRHTFKHEGYVLWNKNRNADVCDPSAIAHLARQFENVPFLTTYSPDKSLQNVKEIGTVKHAVMKELIQKAGVYLSTTKETFGIGVLEAMASGVPVLGFKWGGNVDLIQHGVSGYLADPGNYQQLFEGLDYCMRYRSTLGANSMELVKKWTWDSPIEKLYNVIVEASQPSPPTVAVVIPLYNYREIVHRAIDSVLAQTKKVDEIIVVDDGSTDNPQEALQQYIDNGSIIFVQKANGGVATARNRGIAESQSKYICCLDADDAIEPKFIETCVTALERDRSLGIAYTKIRWIKADGSTDVSQWPDSFNYDRQLERANQIPTCCVFRREMWERIGGYKQRYAPLGAGSEDAEFWLRAGAYGFNARLVTGEPLFIYSLGTGRVSGNRGYHETDWLGWHPWTKDKLHPFASLATPKRISHPVRQYDTPSVSVIIPVGEGHENILEDALDSLEAQEFRRWEAIVVWDSPHPYAAFKNSKAYPYVKVVHTPKPGSGAGVARNLGVKNSRGDFILFLDADDWLLPDTIGLMINAWQQQNSIVYTDYYGAIQVNNEDDLKQFGDRLFSYNAHFKEAVIRHYSADYSCERAQQQPRPDNLYHWCIVTCLIPKVWHDEIGGFDEFMESFEDVDYHWRMARRGKCYTRIKEPLVMYRFSTGMRRENASPYDERTRQRAVKLLEYMLEKYKETPKMPCVTCGQNSNPVQRPYYPYQANAERSSQLPDMNDSSFVKVRYIHPNIGDHRVIGVASKIDYGYRAGGNVFLVHRDDLKASPNLFVLVEDAAGVASAPKPEPKPVEAPKPIIQIETPAVREFDLKLLPGVTPAVVTEMENAGIDSYRRIVRLGLDGLTKIKGIGEARAKLILKYAKEQVS